MAAQAPVFERELLEAWHAGVAAQQAGQRRTDNPHQGDEPGEAALGGYWARGFDSVDPTARALAALDGDDEVDVVDGLID